MLFSDARCLKHQEAGGHHRIHLFRVIQADRLVPHKFGDFLPSKGMFIHHSGHRHNKEFAPALADFRPLAITVITPLPRPDNGKGSRAADHRTVFAGQLGPWLVLCSGLCLIGGLGNAQQAREEKAYHHGNRAIPVRLNARLRCWRNRERRFFS